RRGKEREALGLKKFSCHWFRVSTSLHQPTPIPGFYPVRDFLEDAQLNPVKPTYNFKGEGRKRVSLVQRMHVTYPSTFLYMPPSFVELAGKKLATYSFKNTSRQTPEHSVYKDKVKKEGPGPAAYQIKESPPTPIRSCFLSRVPRLLPSHSKVPGPGSYWPTKQAPKQPRTIASLGREHTIFFSNVPEL
uniref:Sperm-tail PG-rich repeat containing 4 n=1 Tax=Salvator merianae TaxID=96440 RepID=A0A8D0KK34_SALMN